jgi:Ulp1 family protease
MRTKGQVVEHNRKRKKVQVKESNRKRTRTKEQIEHDTRLRKRRRTEASRLGQQHDIDSDTKLYAQKKRALTSKENAKVTRVLTRRGDTILVTQPNANIDLTYELMSCLTPLTYLNDEVINFYFQLLKERNDRAQAGTIPGPQTSLKAHFFNSHFIVQFHGGYSYKKVHKHTHTPHKHSPRPKNTHSRTNTHTHTHTQVHKKLCAQVPHSHTRTLLS